MASYKLIVKNAKVILKTVTNAVLNITGIKDLLTGSGSVDSNTKIDWTLQHYTNTATNFTSTNPILLVGQLGIETDDLLTAPKYKIGDGVTAWNTLPYNSSGGGGLSGLTTNKVLKATSATTAGDSNITDDGTTVSINTKTSITQNTTGTGSKGLSVNFNTIGEVFYIDDNGELIYNANAGATFKGSNGIINVISNGGVNPYIIFKYANGANTSGYLSGDGNSLVIDTAALKVNHLTASELTATDSSKNLVSLPVATYPSLTELSYGKGVTSAIQTQLDGKLNAINMFLTNGNQTTTSNVASNITDLVSPTLTANKRYKISGIIKIACNNSGGVRIQITLPTSATMFVDLTGSSASGYTVSKTFLNASATLMSPALCTFNGVNASILVNGEIQLSSTAGVIQFGFASNTNTQTTTVYRLGTQLTLTQIN